MCCKRNGILELPIFNMLFAQVVAMNNSGFYFFSQGFYEACERGYLTGHKICGVRFVLEDGEFISRKSGNFLQKEYEKYKPTADVNFNRFDTNSPLTFLYFSVFCRILGKH